MSALLPKDNGEVSEGFRAGCLSAVLRLVRQAHALYSGLASSPELFQGIERALLKGLLSRVLSLSLSPFALLSVYLGFLRSDAHASELAGSGADVKTTLEDLATYLFFSPLCSDCFLREHGKTRMPLAQVVRPPTIKQFRPAFEEEFRPGKDYDPSAQRAEVRKLTKKFKKVTPSVFTLLFSSPLSCSRALSLPRNCSCRRSVVL